MMALCPYQVSEANPVHHQASSQMSNKTSFNSTQFKGHMSTQAYGLAPQNVESSEGGDIFFKLGATSCLYSEGYPHVEGASQLKVTLPSSPMHVLYGKEESPRSGEDMGKTF